MHSALGAPRPPTWETLQKSRNLAAIATLAQGLESTNERLRHRCLQSLLQREQLEAYRAILLRWEKLSSDDVELARQVSHRFEEASKAVIAGGSLSEKRSALAAIVALDLVQAIDTVIEIVINPRHALRVPASERLIELCNHWGQLARNGRDVPSIRGKLLDRLYNQLSLFHEHKNATLLEAWLYLVHWSDGLHRSLLADARQDVYRPLLARLATGQEPPIMQLLGGYLTRASIPDNVADLLVSRSEPELAIKIAKLADASSLPMVLRKLRMLPPLRSLSEFNFEECELPFDIKKKLWLMLAASSDDLTRVLQGVIKLSKVGTADARQTAAEMVHRCRRIPIDLLVPAMQEARLSGEPAESNLFDLILEIAGWLKSPSTVLRKAAIDFCKEFTLANLLECVKSWPAQMCQTMATIVRVADTNLAEPLSRELSCPAPKRRLAALQVTEMLACGGEVSEYLVPLLDDSRLDVRVRTIDVLSALGHDALEAMIPQLLADASTDIQDAANRAARRMQRQSQAQR